VPIRDFAIANEELTNIGTEEYFPCCGKSICGGCIHSFNTSENNDNCPFCNSKRFGKTDKEKVEELKKRVEVNDAGAMYVLGSYYAHGQLGLLQDRNKAMELWKQAAKLGSSKVDFALGAYYHGSGDFPLRGRSYGWT
jgi:TPR repeat protein